jgi:hypothetical protein
VPTRVFRGALALAFAAHIGVVVGSQMPRDSAIRIFFDRTVSRYMRITGLWQGWDMFDSAPNYHAYRAELMARMPDGEVRGFPPILPELRPQTRYVRESTYFLRTLDGAYGLYLTGYGKSACRAVLAHTGSLPAAVFVRQHVQRLRTLADIRSNGVIATSQTLDGREVPCEEAK